MSKASELRKRLNNGGVLLPENYIKSYTDDVSSYLNQSQKDYGSVSYQNYKSVYDELKNKDKELKNRGGAIRKYVNTYGANIDKESKNELFSYIDDHATASNEMLSAYKKQIDYYAQFPTKNDYYKSMLLFSGDDDQSKKLRTDLYKELSDRKSKLVSRKDSLTDTELSELNELEKTSNLYTRSDRYFKDKYSDEHRKANQKPLEDIQKEEKNKHEQNNEAIKWRTLFYNHPNAANEHPEEYRKYVMDPLGLGVGIPFVKSSGEKVDFKAKEANDENFNWDTQGNNAFDWDKKETVNKSKFWEEDKKKVPLFSSFGGVDNPFEHLGLPDARSFEDVDDKFGAFQRVTKADIPITFNPSINLSREKVLSDQIKGTGEYRNWDDLTEEEINTYNYIKEQRGQNAADQYLYDAQHTLNVRDYIKDSERYEKWANEHPVLSNIASVPMSVIGGISSGIDLLTSGDDYDPYSNANEWANATQTIRNTTAANIDEATGNANLFGFSFGDMYSAGMSGIDSTVTALVTRSPVLSGMILSGSAGASRAKELYDQGESMTVIKQGAAVDALIEFGTEYIGIDHLLKPKNVKSLTGMFKESLKQAGIEATEEAVNELGTSVYDVVTRGENSDLMQSAQKLMDAGYTKNQAIASVLTQNIYESAMGGFVSGGGSGVAVNLGNYAQYNARVKNVGKSVLDSGQTVNVINAASLLKELNPKLHADAQKLSAVDSQKLIDNKNAESVYTKDIGKLYLETAETASKPYIESIIESQGLPDGVKLEKAVNAVFKKGSGLELSLGEKKAFESVNGEEIIKQVNSASLADMMEVATLKFKPDTVSTSTGLNTDVVNDNSTLSENAFTSPGISEKTSNVTAYNKKTESEVDGSASSMVEYNLSDDGKTYIAGTDQAVNIKNIKSVSENDVIVELEDGNTESVKNLDLGSADDAVLYQGIVDMRNFLGVDIKPKIANSIMLAHKTSGSDARSFVTNAKIALANGYANVKLSNTVNLSPSVADAIYDLGFQLRQAEANHREAESNQKTLLSKNTSVVFEDVVESSLDDRRKVSVNAVKKLAEAIGVNVVFYRSEYKKGKWTSKYDTKNGSPNGFYKASDNTIYLDVNAGMLGRGTILFTASHELVHTIREWSPKSFNTLAHFLMEKYEEKGEDVNSLIRDKMDKLELSYDAAYEEVVADSCESFLVDSNIVERIQELANKDKTLVQKILSYFKNLLNKIKEAYKGMDPDSNEGRIVRQMKDSVNDLHNKFYDALKSASENIQNANVDTTKNTAKNDGVRYSLNRNAKTELHKALYDKNYNEDVLLRDVTPPIMLAQKGVQNLPMVMNISHIRENVFTEAEARQLGLRVNKHTHYHGLGEAFYLKVIDGLDNITEAYRGTKNADNSARRENYFLLVSQFKDDNGNVVNVPVYINETTQHNRVFIDTNKISTVFGRDNFRKYISKEISKGNLVRIKNKSTTSSEPNALIAERYRSNASGNMIPQGTDTVNNQFMQKDRKNSLRDNEYLEAVNNGDMETAQRMVDEAAKENGYNYKLYHQTDSDFTVFDTTHKGAGTSDHETPFGVFMKPTNKNIGLKGSKQMQLFSRITKPLFVKDRNDLINKLSESDKFIKNQREINKLNIEYKNRVEEASKKLENYMLEYRKNNPDSLRTDIYDDVVFNKLSDREDEIIDEWSAAIDRVSVNSKTDITDYLKAQGYDGVIIEYDEGSFGRSTETYIALENTQIKSADPVTYDDNGDVIPLSERFDVENEDIRYSSRDIDQIDPNDYNNIRISKSVFNRLRREAMTWHANKTNRILSTVLDDKVYRYILTDTYELKVIGVEKSENIHERGDLLNGNKQSRERPDKVVSEFRNRRASSNHNRTISEDRREHTEDDRYGNRQVRGQRQSDSPRRTEDGSSDNRQGKTEEVKLYQARPDFDDFIFDDFDGNITHNDSKLITDYILKDNNKAFIYLINNTRKVKLSEDEVKKLVATLFKSYDLSKDKIKDVYQAVLDVLKSNTETEIKNGIRVLQEKFKSVHPATATELTARMIADVVRRKHFENDTEYVKDLVKYLRRKHNERVRDVRVKERKKVKDKEQKKYDALVKKYNHQRQQHIQQRRDYIEKRNRRDIIDRIQKIIKKLDTLLNRGNKKQNIKEEMQGFVSKSLEFADLMFKEEISNKELIEKGMKGGTKKEQNYIDRYSELLKQVEFYQQKYDEARTQNVKPSVLKERYDLLKNKKDLLEYYEKLLNNVFERERAKYTEVTANKVLNDLAAIYSELSKSPEDYIKNAFNSDVIANIYDAISELGEFKIKDMDSQQLMYIYRIYSSTYTAVQNANKMFAVHRKGNRSDLAATAIQRLKVSGKLKNYEHFENTIKSIEKFAINSQKAVYFFRSLGCEVFEDLFWSIQKGQSVYAKDVERSNIFQRKVAKKYNRKTWDFDKKYEFVSRGGKTYSLSLGNIMNLYALKERGKAAENHLLKEGIAIDSEIYGISETVLNEAIAILTEEQKSYLDEKIGYLSTDVAEDGNEVSVILHGVRLFTENKYTPIIPYNHRVAEKDTTRLINRIKNMGFTNSVNQEASGAIVIGDFDTVWANHCKDMAMYHAFALPLEDFLNIYNYKFWYTDSTDSEAVSDVIAKYHSEAAKTYINNWIEDLNGGVMLDGRYELKKLVSLYKAMKTAGSTAVALVQGTSVIKAMNYISPKYFFVTNPKSIKLWNLKKDYAELEKYAPIAIIKRMGYFDTGVGKNTVDWILEEDKTKLEKFKSFFKDKDKRLEVFYKFASLGDEIAWVHLWNAVKAEIKDTTDLQGEAYFDRCGERFNEVVELTQVYDSVISRSAMMRSKDGLAQMATGFMSETTVSSNMLTDAIWQFKILDKKTATKNLIRTCLCLFFTNLMTALIKGIVVAGRDDDDDKAWIEKNITATSNEFFTGLNPFNYLVVFKDIASVIEGYDVQRTDIALVNEVIEPVIKLIKLSGDEEELFPELKTDKKLQVAKKEKGKEIYETCKSFLSAVGIIYNVPVGNIVRDIEGVVNTFVNSDDSTNSYALWEAFVESVPIVGKETKPHERAYNAFKNEDYDIVKLTVNEMIENYIDKGYETDEAEKSVRSNFSNNYRNKYLIAYRSGDKDSMDEIQEFLYSTGLYGSLSDLNKKLKKWIDDYEKKVDLVIEQNSQDE